MGPPNEVEHCMCVTTIACVSLMSAACFVEPSGVITCTRRQTIPFKNAAHILTHALVAAFTHLVSELITFTGTGARARSDVYLPNQTGIHFSAAAVVTCGLYWQTHCVFKSMRFGFSSLRDSRVWRRSLFNGVFCADE